VDGQTVNGKHSILIMEYNMANNTESEVQNNFAWGAIFTAFAAAIIMILQQWETYRLNEIKTEGEINDKHFMKRLEIEDLYRGLDNRIIKIETNFIDRDLIIHKVDEYNRRIEKLEVKVDNLENKQCNR